MYDRAYLLTEYLLLTIHDLKGTDTNRLQLMQSHLSFHNDPSCWFDLAVRY